ncbi:MAG: septal ring lytic transglycosylase RlpA family protein [Treponema sp.]|nr:septal ring lytic transglycosylase RlpA family protein [Treponema sp.]
MKRLNAALILGLFISPFCFAQIQTGNASYNPSKAGFTISHSSLSFNTRVLVTNLRNNRSVEAVVNGRIPIDSEHIADISGAAGDSLEMNKSGATLVKLEVLAPRETEVPAGTGPAPLRSGSPQPPGPPPSSGPQQPPAPSTITQVLPLQTVTEYVPVPAPDPGPVRPCCNASLIWAIFLLLLLVIAILIVILILLLRRLPLWPWYYPLWLRRRYRRLKKQGRRLVPRRY